MAFQGNSRPPTDTGSPRVPIEDLSNGDAFSEAIRHLVVAIGDAKVYLQTLVDRSKIVARNLLLFAILGIVAAVVAATILVSITVIFCIGIAEGFTALCGGRAWVGDLITGVLVLGTLAISARIFVSRLIRTSRKRTFEEYDRQRES